MTGITDLELELVPKRTEILRELGLRLVERPVRTEDEARSVIGAASTGEVDGIFSPRLLALNIPGLIQELAAPVMPTMFHETFFVEQGALVSYSAGGRGLGRQAARLVDKILKGARPGDIPVEQPTHSELAVNLKAAKALGITVPRSILLRANRIIQ